jgi:predicted DNA-binding transcriptional regulator AlpA
MTQPSLREHLTTEQAAEYLSVSSSWLAQSRGRGDGPPYFKIGRAVRYARAALDAWVLSQTVSSTAHAPRERMVKT